MKIIVDAMGGDNAPEEIVRGAVAACLEYKTDIILTGRCEDLLRVLQKMGYKELPKGIEIANASEVIGMDEDPVAAFREKKDSSMAVGLNMLRDGAADAMVSAGSTGALLSGATLVVKRIKGIRRAALAPVFPVTEKGMVLIDCGANTECNPEYLLQFAFMGSLYAERVLGVPKPRVGLLNNGTEKIKGTDLQIDTYVLLEEAAAKGAINFIGNVEAKDVMLGACDVIVTDGFTGNILLKAVEGTAKFLMREIKGVFMSSVLTKLAALLVKKQMNAVKEKMDVDKVGGTVLLGISKPVIKAHGSSNADAIQSAVRQAIRATESGVADEILRNIDSMKLPEGVEKNS